jgi:urease accessory protein
MNRNLVGASLAALILLCFPAIAGAHVEKAAAGFVAGLLHPVLGLDHFLAMLSVGIVSAQLGGRRVYTIPATFVLAMIGGAVAGVHGQDWPYTEIGIALSVVVLGAAIATIKHDLRGWPVLAIMLVVAFFGSLHGHAHGLELPKAADPVYYAGGFVISTTAIHLLGVGIGHWLTTRVTFVTVLRHMGSVMAGMGLMILVNLMAAK